MCSQRVELCYHCHKCTAGCPVLPEMAYGPDQILRLIQLGEREKVLTCGDIWICASCETCGTRCPNEINVAEVMDALRAMSLAQGLDTQEPNTRRFHGLFLDLVGRFGRMHELSLMIIYKLVSMDLMADVGSGIQMMLKGKIPLLPHRSKGADDVKRMYRDLGI